MADTEQLTRGGRPFWRRRWFAFTVVLVVFSILSVIVKLSVWQAPLTAYGGTQDVEQKMWFYTWTPWAIQHHHNPLTSTYLNYPTGLNMMWNTPMFVVGLLFWPVSAIWNTVVTYNLVTTAAMALSGGFAFLAIRRWVHGSLASAIGGLLYGFSPAMIAQNTGHASPVVSAITIPLVVLLLDELLVRQRMRAWALALLLAGLGILQFFLFEEFFVLEVAFGLIAAGLLALSFRSAVRERLPYVLRVLRVAVPLTLLVLAYPLYVQFLGPNRPEHSLHDPNGFSLDLLNPLVPTGIQLFAPDAATTLSSPFSGNTSEADGYLGIGLLVVMVVVLIRHWRFVPVRIAGLMAAVITVCALGPNLHVAGNQLVVPLPWWLPAHVPFLRSLIPSRMMFFVFLGAALLLAFALHRLWRWRRNVILTAAVAAVALGPLVPKLPLPSNTLDVPAYFTSSAVNEIPEGAAVLIVPWPSISTAQGMDWQAASNMRFRLLGGYFFGPVAPDQDVLYQVNVVLSTDQPPEHASPDVKQAFLRQLRENNVGAVIVGPLPKQATVVEYLTEVLDAPPHVHDGIDVWVLHGSS